MYAISQSPSDDESNPDESIREGKLIPSDIFQLIKNHPYTASYKGKADSFDYLAENIDSVERLRSYTNLLEKISELMRKHVSRVGAEDSKAYQDMLEEWDRSHDLYEPKIRVCSSECFGLAKGTRLFRVDVPVFHLQLAEIKGELKIVSAIDYFQ